jgi:membrane associated rhomboid family serine protease
LKAFEREQIERHAWLKNQQTYDFQLNSQAASQYFTWRMTGTIFGGVISIVALIVGGWLVKNGASFLGASAMFAAFGGLVGTAIYGHRVASREAEAEEKSASSTPVPESGRSESGTA